MLEVLRREIIYLWYYFTVQLEQIFLYWVLGMVLGSSVSVFLKDWLHNLFRSLGDKKLGVMGIPVASALGQTALIVRIAFCFLGGTVAGVLIHLFYKGKPFFNFGGFEEPRSRDTDPNLLFRYLKNLWRNIKATGLYFFIGIMLSAAFHRYVPTDIMTGIFSGNEAWGVLMAATIGVPLYACGGGTIPLLQQWLFISCCLL